MGILLRTLPELSFGHALGKGDKNWISECLSKRFCFGFTPIHSLSAEIQPFYVRRRFATSAAQMPLHEKSSWKIEQILCLQWSETKWQIGGGPMFFGYCAPNWLSSQLGNLASPRPAGNKYKNNSREIIDTELLNLFPTLGHKVFYQTSTDLNTIFFMSVGCFLSDFPRLFSTWYQNANSWYQVSP